MTEKKKWKEMTRKEKALTIIDKTIRNLPIIVGGVFGIASGGYIGYKLAWHEAKHEFEEALNLYDDTLVDKGYVTEDQIHDALGTVLEIIKAE